MKTWAKYLRACALGIVYGLAVAVFLAAALTLHDQPQPTTTMVLHDGGCHTPITVYPRGNGANVVSAVFLHGLAADRRVMYYLANSLAEGGVHVFVLDLPGHGDNTDAFSFARAEDCARIAVESLKRRRVIDLNSTVLIGHSMGGAIAVRIADRDPVLATIAISPAPMAPPRRMPANLLVLSAQFDIPELKQQAETLAKLADGQRTAPLDFAQRRAFALQHVPYATHTSLLVNRSVVEALGRWIDDASGSNATFLDLWPACAIFSSEDILWPTAAGLVCLVLFFLPAPMLAAKIAGPTAADLPGANPAAVLVLAEGAVGALAGALILALFVPLEFLHIYSGDYLASLMLIAAVLLLALNRTAAREHWRLNVRALFAAAMLGLTVMLGIGAWLNWQVADLWMNAPRWLRFTGLLPVAWIFCFSEEVVLGPVGNGRRRATRFALSLGLRAELWLACLLTYYTLASGQVLILILVVALALFSILQRLAADALRLRTGSPTAAALFGAILAAWFIAAVFPLI